MAMVTLDAPTPVAPTSASAVAIAPEQALNREDRPLARHGLAWTWTQCRWVLYPACALVVWWMLCALVCGVVLLLTRQAAIGATVAWGALPVPLALACAVLGVRLNREGVDPVECDRLGYRLRGYLHGHAYRPAPPDWRSWRLEARTRIIASHPRTYRLPVRQPRPSATLLSVQDDPDAAGSVRRADGRYVVYLDVRPTILRGKDAARQAQALGILAGVLRGLRPGETVQMRADNRASNIDAVLRSLDRRETAQGPQGAPYRAMRAARRAWAHEEYAHTYAAEAIYTLCLDGDDRTALLRRRVDVGKALEAIGCGYRTLTAGDVSARLTDAASLRTGAPQAALVLDEHEDALHVGPQLARTLPVIDWAARLDLDALLGLPLLPVPATLVYTVRGLDQRAARTAVADRAAYMRNSDEAKRLAAAGRAAQAGSVAVVVTEAQGDRALQGDARALDAVAEAARRGDVGLVDIAASLTVYADDAATLDARCVVARDALEAAGFVVGAGTGAQLPLYRSHLLPLCRMPARPLRATTRTASALVPFVKETPGHPFPGTLLGHSEMGGQLTFFDWRAAPTKAIAILGDQGMGKSTAMGMLLWDTLACGDWATALDPSDSFAGIVRAVGGERAVLLDQGVAINLLEIAGAAKDNPVVALLDVFEHILGGGRADYTLAEEGAEAPIERGLRWLLSDAARRRARGWDGTPRLRRLAVWLRRQERTAVEMGQEQEAATYRRLYGALAPYYGRGSFASLLDYPTTIDLRAPLVLINTSRFTSQKGAVAALGLAVATTVADWRAREAARRGKAARIFVDEGYTVIRLALQWFLGIGRTIRHDNNSIALTAHELADIVNDPSARKMLTAIKTWLLVRVSGDDADVLTEKLRLPRPLVERARTLTRVMWDRSEAIMLTNTAEQAGAEYAVIHIKPTPLLMELLVTYDEDKRALDAATERAGGDAIKAAARLAATRRTRRGSA